MPAKRALVDVRVVEVLGGIAGHSDPRITASDLGRGGQRSP